MGRGNLLVFYKGMSLVELIVVTAITIIIYSVISLSWNMFSSRNLQAEARAIISDLMWTRAMAVANHSDYCIHFDDNGAGKDGYIVYRGAACAGASPVVRSQTLLSQFAGISTPFEVVFYAFNTSPLRIGGTAYSNISVDDVVSFNVTLGGSIKSIQIFEDTGYIKIAE